MFASLSALPACGAFGSKTNASSARTSIATHATSPNPRKVPDSALAYAESLPGITDPFPNIFDPANLLGRADGGVRPVEEVKRWREAEITHGRVAMLAALGFLVGEQLENFPVFLNVDGHVTGPAIYHFQQVEARGAIFWEPVLFGIALCESYRVSVGWANPVSEQFNTLRSDYAPGELGFDPLGLLNDASQEDKIDLQNKELNNGRLAMIGIAGFVAQELVDGQTIIGHLGGSEVPEVIKNTS